MGCIGGDGVVDVVMAVFDNPFAKPDERSEVGDMTVSTVIFSELD